MPSRTTKNLLKAMNEHIKSEHFYADGLLWRDCTSYRFDVPDEERKPTSFEAYVGDIRIQITFSNAMKDMSCNGWVFMCKQLGLGIEKTDCKTRLEAANYAFKFCKGRVNRWQEYFTIHLSTQN